ncbi:aldose 1-epimerase family protein [Subtercola vilae]|uniref:Aldose epimerase n=1 Tax=Subtercola vilae TaxID=2056433 RepID=A0A4T2C9K6_9MICO|nr:aldose 1-epimerase family protein [Subtercola vilae]TIH40362.1 aldose epimerase [Subtercola vilae]
MSTASTARAADTALPTGSQFELSWAQGEHRTRAVVTAVGATLRVLEVDGTALIEGFAETAAPLFCAGQILVPWPNRVRDGSWSYDGRDLQLPLTEPDRGNALHGFLFGLPHEPISQSDSMITLRAVIAASDAYPFTLTVDTTYTVGPDGLTVNHDIRNDGEAPAPAAIGAHPYFRIGDVPTEQLTITVNATMRVSVDARLNPTGTAAVAGTAYDLSQGAVVGTLDLDTAYFGLTPGADGTYRHTIAAPDGRRIELWGDQNYKHTQVFTTQIFPTPAGLGWAVTVEPTTAPPDALNTGEDLRWIEPADTWHSTWGITFVAAAAESDTAAEPEAPEGEFS